MSGDPIGMLVARICPMSDQLIPVRSLVAPMIAHLAAAIPQRSRWTFTELLAGAAVTVSGHITEAIDAAGHSRAWMTYFWFVERARWSWLALWAALLALLKQQFTPAVWHVILDGPERQRRRRYTVVERVSTRVPEYRRHFHHTAKPNRPRFVTGQGWVCLTAVVERGWTVGAVPLTAIGGMGGVGKTALAVHVAHRLAARYPDGQIAVDLKGTAAEPLSPVAAMGRVIFALDPARKLPADEGDLAGLYRSLLAGKRLFILFDNAADAAQVCELLPSPPCAVIGDRRGEGAALFNLGNVYLRLGEYRRAIEYYEQSLAIAREIGYRQSEGAALGNLGNAHHELDEYRRAIEYHEQALVISREIGDRQSEGTDLFNGARGLYAVGKHAEAIARMQAAVEIYAAIESPFVNRARVKLAAWSFLNPLSAVRILKSYRSQR